MLAVVHAVVCEKEKAPSCMTVWDIFHALLACTFVSSLRTKKKTKIFI